MASSKEMQHSSRPVVQHRSSMSGSLPRPPNSRGHSHSVSSGSLVPPNRVTRRKSVTSTANNVAAMVAAVAESGNASVPMPIASRRNTSSKRSGVPASLPSPPPSLSNLKFRLKSERDENAIDSDQNDDMEDENQENFGNARTRRASEGQHLVKDGKKSNGGDLKCDKCGKGYKHSSCLSKHLWEHTPEWSYTSKLLISKHQQVQLLEAASVLLTMNQGGVTPPDSAKDFESDNQDGSASPATSSEQRDAMSSADTTPPPENLVSYGSGSYRSTRYSSGSGQSGFSRSYQSAPSANFYGSSIPSTYGHSRQQSHERRPMSSGISQNRGDEGLAAAVELLSCSFGSAGQVRTVPVTLPEDAPPVPHIPAQYLNQDSYSASELATGHQPRQTESYTRHQVHEMNDAKMDDSDPSVADDEYSEERSREPSDEDDDGVFGRMEE